MPAHLAQRGRAEAARGFHELLLAQREELSADEARHRHPAQPTDHDDDQNEHAGFGAERFLQRLAKEIDEQEQQGKAGETEEQVRDAHQRVVHGAPRVAGRGADEDTHGDGDQHGRHADGERDPAAVEHAGQHVLPQVIGAERMRPRRPFQLGLEVDLVDRHPV